MASICIERRSSAMSRSYWVCRFNQNCAETPKYLPSRSAAAPTTRSSGQKVVGGDGSDTQEEDVEGGLRVGTEARFVSGPPRSPPTAEAATNTDTIDVLRRDSAHSLRPYRCYHAKVWSVDIELIAGWLTSLDSGSQEQVVAAIELLEEQGPRLGRPLVDTIKASRHKNMKELRPGSTGRSELRILFAFDPKRQAILLIAGDKSGNWTRWYKRNIPIADDLFDKHLQNLRGE